MAFAVPIVVGIATAAMSVYQGMKMQDAADEQEDIAKRNAEREQREAEEAVRREKKEFQAEESLDRARAAASGIDVDKSKSTVLFMAEKRKSHQEEIDWMKSSAASRADIIKREGRLAADQTRAEAWGHFANAVGSAGKAASAGIAWYESS